jgi:hypothetical protein
VLVFKREPRDLSLVLSPEFFRLSTVIPNDLLQPCFGLRHELLMLFPPLSFPLFRLSEVACDGFGEGILVGLGVPFGFSAVDFSALLGLSAVVRNNPVEVDLLFSSDPRRIRRVSFSQRDGLLSVRRNQRFVLGLVGAPKRGQVLVEMGLPHADQAFDEGRFAPHCPPRLCAKRQELSARECEGVALRD